jgi:hypothetical protein
LIAAGLAGACGFAAATGAFPSGVEGDAFLTDRIDLPGAGLAGGATG